MAGDGLFAAGPERFVESGALARMLRRLAEPRRAVKIPDAAHDFHAVWGVALPRDLAALWRAVTAVDLEWLARWRPAPSASFVLPGRAKDNLVDRILAADRRDRRGTALVELCAGAPAVGDLRGGGRLLYGLHDAPPLAQAPIWIWEHEGRVFRGPVAASLSALAWSSAVAVAQRERLIGPEPARAALARIAAPPAVKRAATAAAIEQNRWLLLLLRDADPVAAAVAFAGARRPALGAATLARTASSVPAALDGLFRAFLLADRPELVAAHVAAASGSRSRLIRDAARLVDELGRGRKQVGRVRDVRRAREALRAALGRSSRARR
ncbi:MAG TPA: hypothetical protein VFU21_03475 [Kofleriaceae bacterium]|nr:hypothetical protein [Kofleriaceae bacterium]